MTSSRNPGLAGRTAVVIGAARPPGIGRAVALRFAAAGADVVCVDEVIDQRTPSDTSGITRAVFDQVVAEIAAVGTGSVIGRACRTTSEWADVVAEVAAERGRLDICCALGGVTGPAAGDGPLLAVPDAAMARCLQVNLIDSWRVVQAAATAMVDGGRPGTIVALSTHAATVRTPGAGAVGAARSALEHLVAGLAAEVAPHGVRCATVGPLGVAPTELFPNPGLAKLAERDGLPLETWLARSIPLGRPQQADETAAVIEFLCSEQASFVTGVTIGVHGGAGR
ncbi:SDR family NAD(P)-dependent oxidoreductase [Nakamurella lactea]|jgi:NAD(P)-dependent dehydrogenase (short-subunit alcohol dehydrogenase family)|uniref:SDR family NAD(P)-dependent oxidoreductase n=1 Tax=Nakamurella lactea TaxID=459515 RepID=UPI00048B1184|nr:SDR family oxidoreductase [Nakamurella lactea]